MIKKLLGKQLLFFDGAMGTLLQSAGLKAGEQPVLWNLTHADVVTGIHKKYFAAGADIVKTNTFGANARALEKSGYAVDQIVKSAVANAKNAAAEFSASKPRFVALDIGPTGKLLKPLGDMHFSEAYELFSETVAAGVKAGADLILIETMSDAYELKAAVLAAKENSDLPVLASVTLDEKGKMLTGGGADVAVALLEGLRVDAIGFNCGLGPEQLSPYVRAALKISSVPLLLMPNAGLPQSVNGVTQFNVGADEFSKLMKGNAENGVWLLGGCCGTTPEHIEAAVKSCAGITPPAVSKKNITVASSYSKTVIFGEKPVIVGERINPTGKPRLKQAIKDENYDFVLQEGIVQTEQGALVLDVNAGMPGINEGEVLTAFVERLQSVVDAPLQIDSADVNALSQAVRAYNGKPVINSVNGKRESMEAVFPLVQKYGGLVVALTLDENGIPETARGRIEIAKKILTRAESYGIGREEFLFDPLTMAVSAGSENALVTLECVRLLKEELGVKTILGVSNVSFGLPQRDILNSAFLFLALGAGLSAAIINPKLGVMHKAIEARANGESGGCASQSAAAVDALLGKDSQFERYVSEYGGGQTEDSLNGGGRGEGMALKDAVFKGLKQEAALSAKISLEKTAPMVVIEKELIHALNMAGEYFESGKIYLPQLLMCAEAAKSAFSVVRSVMEKEGGDGENDTIGTIVLATVEGDIHDIGKNIARAILENYRFNVIDLGKDVPVQGVVDAVKKHGVKLAGLSALMTTTVVSMEKTIKEIRAAGLDCKIICGGAVLTEEYAKNIGADFYAKDAMSAVRYAQSVFAK